MTDVEDSIKTREDRVFVGHHEQRRTRFFNLVEEQVEDRFPRDRIEIAGRFIREHQGG